MFDSVFAIKLNMVGVLKRSTHGPDEVVRDVRIGNGQGMVQQVPEDDASWIESV